MQVGRFFVYFVFVLWVAFLYMFLFCICFFVYVFFVIRFIILFYGIKSGIKRNEIATLFFGRSRVILKTSVTKIGKNNNNT